MFTALDPPEATNHISRSASPTSDPESLSSALHWVFWLMHFVSFIFPTGNVIIVFSLYIGRFDCTSHSDWSLERIKQPHMLQFDYHSKQAIAWDVQQSHP
uniref:Uncharacterized protein n=1 Tax=Opuntia streptacantha TaxID=393608 RepID=A0A7C9DJ49_OPUST